MREIMFRVRVRISNSCATDDIAYREEETFLYFSVDKDFFSNPFTLRDTLDIDGYSLLEILGVDQCLGIKDKKGKWIYDQDIYKELYYHDYGQWSEKKERLGIISWSEHHCGFDPFYYWGTDHNFTHAIKDFEVIGNVYDNPQLLKKVKR